MVGSSNGRTLEGARLQQGQVCEFESRPHHLITTSPPPPIVTEGSSGSIQMPKSFRRADQVYSVLTGRHWQVSKVFSSGEWGLWVTAAPTDTQDKTQ